MSFISRNHPQQVGRHGALDEVDDRETTTELFDPLNALYGFTLDVAAAPHNAKCARYFTRADDGLTQAWDGSVWCNPPYSGLSDWLAKAWQEWRRPGGPTVLVMLLPANRTEQKWWTEHVEPFRDRPGSALRVEFLAGRRRFILPGDDAVQPNARPPFGLCVLSWTR